MIDLVLLIIFAAVTWSVASEGAWGGALLFLIVLFSALLAMNFFEPVAFYLQQYLSSSPFWRTAWDVIALVGLFALFVALMRWGAEYLSPRFIFVHPLLYQFTRWTCAALAGYVTMAFLMTALHTGPLPREFWGFTPEPARRTTPIASMAPDFQWLGFTQYVSEFSFRRGGQDRLFDGPRGTIGERQNDYWPSFPIRYAHRREVPGAATPTTPAPGAAQPGAGGPRPAAPSAQPRF